MYDSGGPYKRVPVERNPQSDLLQGSRWKVFNIGGIKMNTRAIKIAYDLMTILDNQCRDTEYQCECCELYVVDPHRRTSCDRIVEVARDILKEVIDE